MATTQITTFNPAQVPAHLRKAELSAMAKALAGGSATPGKRISVKGGVFRLYVDGKEMAAIEERHLDVVIVNAAPKIARTFYAKVFDENTQASPDCWSPDGDKPSPQAKDIQSATCATCPQNIKGSGQGDSRACRFSQRVAVVLANDMGGDVLQLSLAATSIFGKAEGDNRPLQAYARWLAEQGIDPGTLVTRLKFDTSAATPKLFFKAMRWLTDEEYAQCVEQGQSDDAIKAITLTVKQMDKVEDAPAKPAAALPGKPPTKAAPKPAPAPVQAEEEPEEEVVEAATVEEPQEEAPPTKRKVAAKAAPATKSSLAATLAEWTDD